ncbi:hypothetical protein CERZMDRAFT_83143 [Cercospora zeae-maydis SCOH1-5]|uniref:Uncharacterized protein n=1 Tax=Cercospora zeae-maydis SCOH1-5 TaxID=717836 RepID=A0A6A6FLV8_9PEZI|nr:hypothetical protein CERZMDRAFT_83143 [Cercospora zeae-maydis SCOH1-5]
MESFQEPRADHRLCSAVRAGSIPSTQQAIEELKNAGWPVPLSRAMVTCIETTNFPALLLLLSYGAVDEEVAEAAAMSENIHIVQVVLEHGWCINSALRGGTIPSILRQVIVSYLQRAMLIKRSFATSNVDFLERLLELGADPNAESNIGETALSFAIREGTMNVVKRLIAAGADVTKGDVLHCTARREPSEDIYDLVTMLVKGGALVDTYQWDNKRGRQMRLGYPQGTALHNACKEGNYPAAAALLAYGADPHCLKKRGERLGPPSPVEITRPQTEMRKLLESYAQSQATDGVCFNS